MEGTVTWAQVAWMFTIISFTAIAGFLTAWRIQIMRSRDRHDTRSSFEQRTVLLDQEIEAIKTAFEVRVSAIERFNAGAIVVLENMKQFRAEVDRQFDRLRRERSHDMSGIHRRLDALYNVARGVSVDPIEEPSEGENNGGH